MAEDPVSVKCRIMLEKGLDKETCYDFRRIRAYVMCKTWDIMEKERVPFRDAIRRAWAEAKAECARISAPV